MITSIQTSIQKQIENLYSTKIETSLIQLQKTKKKIKGHITLIIFPLLKISKKNPEKTANEIGSHLLQNIPFITEYQTIKGFLNLSICAEYWINALNFIHNKTDYGTKKINKNAPLIMIEYSSPNTNKPLHLGHIRNNLLGHSISEILKATGNRVVKTNLINDRGVHICKSMLAWKKWGNGETPKSSKKKGDHIVGDCYIKFNTEYKKELSELKKKGLNLKEAEEKSSLMQEVREMLRKWECNDPETIHLWEKINQWVYEGFDETYKRLGISFDKIYYESQTYLEGKKNILEGVEKGIFYKKEDGSVWVDLTSEGLDEKLLLRGDGTSIYITQDIGTAKLRFNDFSIHQMIYIVGNEQIYHFKVLSLLLDKLGFEFAKNLVHFSYGMVELPEGKMKSREGTIVDADDLMEEMIQNAKEISSKLGKISKQTEKEAYEIYQSIGLGALKYFILKIDPRKNIVFNPKESIDFNGNTGPFIQYTYARIQSVLKKSNANIHRTMLKHTNFPVNEKEKELIQTLIDFPYIIEEASKNFNPATIANYIYNIVKLYNQFYHDYSILKEENEKLRQFRLILSYNTGKIIAKGFNLLGINVLEKM